MIIIFSGSDYQDDPQIKLLTYELRQKSIKFLVVDPFKIERNEIKLVQEGSRLSILSHGKRLFPTVIYLSVRWRSDSLINLPSGIKYPSVYRSQVEQFLQDIRFAMESVRWIPGKYEAIERAESKPRMLACAAQIGLNTPDFTVNSFCMDKSFGEKVFRKKLGFPFLVSVNTRKGIEVGVTTVGTEVQICKPIKSKSPWQWQQAIVATSHIRCCLIGKQLWSVISDYPSRFSMPKDFRELNEINQQEFVWKNIILSDDLASKLIKLHTELGITISCPEFLVTADKKLILIDLNPCGDWFGFFDQKTNSEIARLLALHLDPD